MIEDDRYGGEDKIDSLVSRDLVDLVDKDLTTKTTYAFKSVEKGFRWSFPQPEHRWTPKTWRPWKRRNGSKTGPKRRPQTETILFQSSLR